MRIGELASRVGVSVRALRYYEEQALIYSTRTSSGQRIYDEKAIDRVRLIRQLFSAGLSSRTIVEVLPCMDTGSLNVMQRNVLTTERDRIDGQIASLNDARMRLHDVIEAAAVSA